MPVGYANNGMDFDDIFEPITTTKRADVGYAYAGTDISNRYEKASSGTPAGNVGYKDNGTDIGPLFAAKGGVVYWDGTLADLPASDVYQNTGDPQNYALLEYALLDTGDIRYRDNRGTSELIVGAWDGAVANATNTEVKCVLVGIVSQGGTGNTTSASPSTYTSINTSAGVITVQTGTTQGDFIEAEFDVYLRETGDATTEIVKRVTLRASYSTASL